MKTYAIDQGVPSDCIFMDHAGFSTYESMYRAKEANAAISGDMLTTAGYTIETDLEMLRRLGYRTQEYHLYRALYDAMAFGLDVRGVSCDTAVYEGDTYRKTREGGYRTDQAT